jgi:HK97 family phage major capsid protein
MDKRLENSGTLAPPRVGTGAARPLDQTEQAVVRFLTEQQGARRFHKATIGDVDPEHCFADFVSLIWKAAGNPPNSHDARTLLESRYHCKAAMGETSGQVGGYTVPIELRHDLEEDASEFAIVRPRALSVPMFTNELQVDLPDAQFVPTSVGQAAWYSGLKFTWKTDGATRDETEPSFSQVDLIARDLGGYALVSNTLLADTSARLDPFLRLLFSSAIAWYEDLAFLFGSGVGQPLGLAVSGHAILLNRSGASHIAAVDTQKMMQSLLPISWNRSIWLAHPSALTDITGITGWIPNGPLVLHGRPIIVTEKCADLGSKGDLILCDPYYYVIGDRQGMQIAVSQHEPAAYPRNRSVFRTLFRTDGKPWWNKAITLQDTSKTVSSAVVLN